MTRRFFHALPLLLVCAVADAQPAATSTISSDALRAAASEMPRLHSLVVSRRGSVVFEHYAKGFGPTRVANVKSASKSVISLLVGIAIDRHLLEGVNQPIAGFFPRLAQDPDPRKGRITIEDLLTMRTGLASTSFDGYGASVRSPNWVNYVLNRPCSVSRGRRWSTAPGVRTCCRRS